MNAVNQHPNQPQGHWFNFLFYAIAGLGKFLLLALLWLVILTLALLRICLGWLVFSWIANMMLSSSRQLHDAVESCVSGR
jgi:uncharacterized membrane protein